MTCGIYKLNFNNTDKVYIGQSTNIEKRILQHRADMRSGRASPKMQEAYKTYGLPISYDILCEAHIDQLDSLEEEAIAIFDSVNNGFNTYVSPFDTPSYTGYGCGNSKYSKENIIKVLLLLQNPNVSFSEIEKVSGVKSSSIANIAACSSHFWLKEEYPKEYAVLENLKGIRNKINCKTRGSKISAKSQGIVYPKIKSPLGKVYVVNNAYSFAREHGIAGNHLTEVLNGHRKSHKGWKVCQEEHQ